MANQQDVGKSGRPGYYLKADDAIINWQKDNQVTDWVAYVPDAQEEASIISDDGPDVVKGSMQIEKFKVGDVSVQITRYRVKASRGYLKRVRKSLSKMREAIKEHLPVRKSRIESLQRFLEELEQTGSYPTQIVGITSPNFAHPPTREEKEEFAKEAKAVLEDRLQYGWLQASDDTQQKEDYSSGQKSEQLTKAQSVEGEISSPKGHSGFEITPVSPPCVGSNFNTGGTTNFHAKILNSVGGTVYYGSKHRLQKHHWHGWKDWSISCYSNSLKIYPEETPTGSNYFCYTTIPLWYAYEPGEIFRFRQESYIYSPGGDKVTGYSQWITFTIQPY